MKRLRCLILLHVPKLERIPSMYRHQSFSFKFILVKNSPFSSVINIILHGGANVIPIVFLLNYFKVCLPKLKA